ncbi:hypothetical protein OH784_11000 [Ectobacillus funiculus]|uniref:hypothetical protein n=1 Tax=Ectobacillus funiculus TaxID=137993 RepID=UPI00397DB207
MKSERSKYKGESKKGNGQFAHSFVIYYVWHLLVQAPTLYGVYECHKASYAMV